MKHKHCELIKAWADGTKIETRYTSSNATGEWIDFNGDWSYTETWEYRIKPEPKPDVVRYCFMLGQSGYSEEEYKKFQYDKANLKIIWDGETGELKSAEVLK